MFTREESHLDVVTDIGVEGGQYPYNLLKLAPLHLARKDDCTATAQVWAQRSFRRHEAR